MGLILLLGVKGTLAILSLAFDSARSSSPQLWVLAAFFVPFGCLVSVRLVEGLANSGSLVVKRQLPGLGWVSRGGGLEGNVGGVIDNLTAEGGRSRGFWNGRAIVD